MTPEEKDMKRRMLLKSIELAQQAGGKGTFQFIIDMVKEIEVLDDPEKPQDEE